MAGPPCAATVKTRAIHAGDRRLYCEKHDLGEVPEGIPDFGTFLASRKDRMAARIRAVLAVSDGSETENGETDK